MTGLVTRICGRSPGPPALASHAPIDVITEEAGFSRGAFYSNFESKDELFTELFEKSRRDLGELIGTHFDRLGIRSSLTPYEFGAAQIVLSHGLALQRAAAFRLR